MITRIETLDDLLMWVNCMTKMSSKNVSLPELKLTPEESGASNAFTEAIRTIMARIPGPFKKCIKCGSIWPANKVWFRWSGQGRDGLHGECKFCYNKERRVATAKKKSPDYTTELASQKTEGERIRKLNQEAFKRDMCEPAHTQEQYEAFVKKQEAKEAKAARGDQNGN